MGSHVCLALHAPQRSMYAGPWSSRPSQVDQGDCRNSAREAQSIGLLMLGPLRRIVLADSRVRDVAEPIRLGGSAGRERARHVPAGRLQSARLA